MLVTNDDGVKAPGIDVLVEALRRLPNVTVTVVAPAENRSGTSDRATPDPASVTTSKTTTMSGYPAVAVNGFPADTVIWALGGGVKQRPDLVVSGINAGENIGASVPLSGTVGAGAHRGSQWHSRPRGESRCRGPTRLSRIGAPGDRLGQEPSQRDPGRSRQARAPILSVSTTSMCPRAHRAAVHGLVKVPVSGAASSTPDCTSTATAPADDVTGFTAGYATLSEMRSSAVCSRFAASTDPVPALQDPLLDEVSGVVASRVHTPDLWVHNDSGGEPAVYAITPDGALLGAYTIDGATNVDWEDIAVGPGPQPGTSYLYVADIGDNASAAQPGRGLSRGRADERARRFRRMHSKARRRSPCITPTTRSTRSR